MDEKTKTVADALSNVGSAFGELLASVGELLESSESTQKTLRKFYESSAKMTEKLKAKCEELENDQDSAE